MAYPTAYTSAVAIPLPSEEAVRQIMGNSYDPERTLNVLKMFAGTEDLFEATISIVRAMFHAKGIDPKTREMIILRTAKVLNAPYEAQANVQMARNAGLSLAEIDAAATDDPVSGINPEYVLVCKACWEQSREPAARSRTVRIRATGCCPPHLAPRRCWHRTLPLRDVSVDLHWLLGERSCCSERDRKCGRTADERLSRDMPHVHDSFA